MPRCAADAATCALISKVIAVVINPLLLLLGAVAGLVFVWGVVEYLWKLRNGESTNDGKNHMLWGLVGLFIIVAALAIMSMIWNTVRLLLP